MTTLKNLELWREDVRRDAIAQGLPVDLATLVAEQVGQSNATSEMRYGCDVYRACKVVGAVKLAPLAIRSRMPLHRVDATLMNALPRSGPIRDRMTLGLAGVERCRLAFTVAAVAADAYRGAAR